MKSTIRRHTALLVSLPTALALGLLATTPARAQGETQPPPPAGSVVGSNAAPIAGAGIGVGATQFLSGLTGAQFVYDQAVYHLEGIFAFDTRDVNNTANSPRATVFQVGVGGWYHLHRGVSSDFSVGGDVAIATSSTSAGGGSATATVLEPAAQVRVFLTPNVALEARAGLTFEFGDAVGTASTNGTATGGVASHISLGGQVLAAFGFTYFFR